MEPGRSRRCIGRCGMEWKNRGLKIDRLGNVIFVLTNQRLESLIKRAYAQTSQKVVVLIDEYDALRLL